MTGKRLDGIAWQGRRNTDEGRGSLESGKHMTDHGPAIVIEGKREDWPGGTRILTPLPPEPQKPRACWFGAALDPDGNEVWFRITWEAIRGMKEKTPGARGEHLIDVLLAWMTADRQLVSEFNRFQVCVSDNGDTTIDGYGD